ncbi:MAG: hypothetical protein OXM61_07535 [Candidatus Poribacteria bacterium]|nr:hypothetical protein [Candidatus Poribacteria bacterium]
MKSNPNPEPMILDIPSTFTEDEKTAASIIAAAVQRYDRLGVQDTINYDNQQQEQLRGDGGTFFYLLITDSDNTIVASELGGGELLGENFAFIVRQSGYSLPLGFRSCKHGKGEWLKWQLPDADATESVIGIWHDGYLFTTAVTPASTYIDEPVDTVPPG